MKALADVFRVAEDPLVKKLESLRAAEAKGELDALDKQRGCVGESVAKAVGTTLLSAKDRSIGCLLGVMMGDCLGAAVRAPFYALSPAIPHYTNNRDMKKLFADLNHFRYILVFIHPPYTTDRQTRSGLCVPGLKIFFVFLLLWA